MVRVYLGIGSNQGDRFAHCREALRRLREVEGISIKRLSSAYETEPVGEGLQGWFLNAVAEAETNLGPLTLLGHLKRIEEEMGRSLDKGVQNRPIDLDLLLYGDLLLEGERLTVPHCALHQRRFVLEPLGELASAEVHPGSGKTVEDLLRELADPHEVRRLEEAL